MKYQTAFKLFIVNLWIGILIFGFNNVYALNLDKTKEYFISGDYKAAISEGERILAGINATDKAPGLDELYYFLGLSYLKDGNYLRASDIFEIILDEFKKSPLAPDASLALADTFLFRGNYEKAEKDYKDLLNNNDVIRLKPAVYYRLSLCASKSGKPQTAKEYLLKLKQEFPFTVEPKNVEQEFPESNSFYSVQLGVFSGYTNAKNLEHELTGKGYSAYIEETTLQDKKIYRVKTGKATHRREAEVLEAKLSKEGYPTKICP